MTGPKNPLQSPWQAAQTYVGTPYVAGVFDCADLAVQVQREVFGRTVCLPQDRPRPQGTRGQGAAITRLHTQVADRMDVPCTGHGVLMFEGFAGTQTWHIGTVFLHPDTGAVWVLHNSAKLQSAALQSLDTLQRFGLKLEGFYAWHRQLDGPLEAPLGGVPA